MTNKQIILEYYYEQPGTANPTQSFQPTGDCRLLFPVFISLSIKSTQLLHDPHPEQSRTEQRLGPQRLGPRQGLNMLSMTRIMQTPEAQRRAQGGKQSCCKCSDHNLEDYDRHIATSLETFSIKMYRFNRIPCLLHWPLIHNVYLKLTEHA